MAEKLLELTHVSMAFGGLHVVNDLDLHVDEGEIVSVIGPNGAGKTTLFNLVTGIYPPDEGEIVFVGESLRDLDPHEITALRAGIRHALRRGIERQGADLGDNTYSGGRMQDEFRAYGRGGEPCRRCRTPITKTRVAGRGTWFCPTCQAARRSSSRRSST